MAASVPGQMPYKASPMASGYDAALNAALRKKRLSELLQQQAFAQGDDAALHTPGAKMSFLNPVAKLAQALAAAHLGKQADTAEASANEARDAGFADYLKQMPRNTPDIPGAPIEQEDVAPPPAPMPMPPPAPPPAAAAFSAQGMPNIGPRDNELTGSASPMAALLAGGAPPPPTPLAPPPVEGAAGAAPFLPKQPMDMAAPGMLPKLNTDMIPGKKVAPEDMLQYAAGMNKFGPAGADLGKQLTASALSEIAPKSLKDRYMTTANGDVLDLSGSTPKYLPAGPETLAKQGLAEKAQRDAAAERTLSRQRLEAKDKEDREFKERMNKDNNETRRALHAAIGSLGGAGATTDVGVDATNGNPVVRGKDGRRYTMDSETGKATPYTGEVIPQTAHEKNVKEYMTAQTEAKMAESAAAVIRDPANADAFDMWKRGAMGLGMSPQQAGVSEGGQRVLAQTGRDFAEQTKKLYGASFTDSEQKRAAGFTITNKDDAKSAAIKADDAARFAREMSDKYGGAAAAASNRRMGGGTAPAAAPGGGWGKAQKG